MKKKAIRICLNLLVLISLVLGLAPSGPALAGSPGASFEYIDRPVELAAPARQPSGKTASDCIL